MSKIMFVGDTHLTGISPVSRKETNEQYRQVLLGKLDSIKDICIKQNISYVIILGDVFNNNSGITNYFETDIWSKLLEFKHNNIEVHTIIGNHDMAFQNETEFKGTYLYKAFLAGILYYLDELTIGPVTIKGIDYNKDFVKVADLRNIGSYNICVAHCFYENERFGGTGNSNLTQPKCLELGYNAYVLGHDHTPYPMVEEPTYKVIRPGSLTRGTSKTCNLYRKVTVSVFDISNFTWSDVEIPTKPGVEVFNEKVVISKDMDLNLEELLNNFSISKDMNVYDILDNNEANGRAQLKENYDEVLDLITKSCEARGIYRKLEEANDN